MGDTLLKIGLVVLGAILKTALDFISSFSARSRKRRDFADALRALLHQLRFARDRQDWRSPAVRAHVDRVLDYYKAYEPGSLHRTRRVRSELLDLYGRLKWFTALRLEPETLVPKAEWFNQAVPLQLSDLSYLVPIDRAEEAKKYFHLTADKVEAGDLAALERLPAAAAVMMKSARECYAGAGYAGAAKEVLDRVKKVEQLAPQRAFDDLIQRVELVLSFDARHKKATI